MLSAVVVSACVSHASTRTMRPELLGTYRFDEQVSPDVRLEGQFVVGQDSVAIDATPGPCRYEQNMSNALTIYYRCADVTFAFDRADPVRRARYTAVVHLRETRSVCVRYARTSTGQTICAASRYETVYRDTRRSGVLRVGRVDDVM